jgi:hypothetical protein
VGLDRQPRTERPLDVGELLVRGKRDGEVRHDVVERAAVGRVLGEVPRQLEGELAERRGRRRRQVDHAGGERAHAGQPERERRDVGEDPAQLGEDPGGEVGAVRERPQQGDVGDRVGVVVGHVVGRAQP